MKNLPNIDFTIKEIEKIVSTSSIKGGEAYICSSGNPNSLYKIFYQDDIHDPLLYSFDSLPISLTSNIVTMSNNKLRKLERLYQMQLEHSTRPISTISVNGELVGYEMTRNPQDITLETLKLSREEMIDYLKQTKEILEYFAEHDILYGDVALRNVLVNPKTRIAKFCDMDNIRLGQYDIDVRPYELISYLIDRGSIDEKVDAYMHGYLTINSLGIDLELCFLKAKYFKENLKDGALEIIDGLSNPREFTGEYLIQYVKK